MLHKILLFVCCLALTQARAQEVQFNEDSGIGRLVSAWVNANRTNPKVEGWRVQIMSGTDRQAIEDSRKQFRLRYPEVPADWVHEKPYYKLRVGAFRSKQEALAFIATLEGYPGAYPARDVNIHPRDFLAP